METNIVYELPTKRARSKAEDLLAWQIQVAGLPEPQREYRLFAERVGGPGRGVRERLKTAGYQDWRFDFCWPGNLGLCVEVQGGGWVRGKHHRPAGYENDCRKMNAAVLLGWRVLWFTPEMIESGEALRVIEEALT